MDLEKIDDWFFDHLPGWLYRIPYRIKDAMRSVKYFFQKVIRRSHTSDIEIWNINYPLAKFTYRKLKAYKNAPRKSYPAVFIEYHEHEWSSKEEYDKAIQDGRMVGGGPDAWEKVVDEILFAFEWFLVKDSLSYKKKRAFYEKWDLENPEEEVEENLVFHYWYDLPDGHVMMTGEKLSPEEEKEKNARFSRKDSMYYNISLEHTYAERAQKGFEAFGKYFMDLWD